LTDIPNCDIILGKDGLVGFSYEKRGRIHRKVLFEVRGTQVILRHPVSKADIIIGQAKIQNGQLVCTFPLQK
jgi:hypothetical protein